MRILHVTPYYHPAMGGAEIHMKEISERLVRRGHNVTVLAMNSGGVSDGRSGDTLKDGEVLNGVKVSRFTPAVGVHKLFNRFLSLRGAHRLLGLAVAPNKIQMLAAGPYSVRPFLEGVRSKPDVVAVSNWYCGSLAYQICKARWFQNFALIGIPLFHTERSWSQSSLYTEMLGHCDAVVALTEYEKQFIEQRSTQENTYVVGVGVDPSLFAHPAGNLVRARYGIGDAPLVGYVGRMTATKGVATLIEAMKGVWQTNPTVRLLLAGSGPHAGSNQQDEIIQVLAGLSNAERARIVMIGRFSDGEKASIFDALDLFAMPSVAESFGVAYLEAWICKKAVIGSRIGSTQCVIEDGVDGVLVAPGNPEDLAGSILWLLADHATREKMGRMGHSKTMSRFTWDKVTDSVEHVYNQAHVATLKQRSSTSAVKPSRDGKSRSKCAKGPQCL